MQFAFWLAARLGYYNVDEMLASAPAGMLDRWQVYAGRAPWGDDWLQTSVATTSIVNTIRAIAAGMGGSSLKERDLLEPDYYVPGKKAKKKNRMTDAQEMARVLKAATGV